MLITDSHGIPFYYRSLNEFEDLNKNLFSGLIYSIGQIGKQIFNQNLATIHFGTTHSTHLVIITKSIFSEKRVLYFAFFIEGDCDNILMREISSSVFIETKTLLKVEGRDDQEIQATIDEFMDKKYGTLAFCQE